MLVGVGATNSNCISSTHRDTKQHTRLPADALRAKSSYSSPLVTSHRVDDTEQSEAINAVGARVVGALVVGGLVVGDLVTAPVGDCEVGGLVVATGADVALPAVVLPPPPHAQQASDASIPLASA